MLRGDDHGIQVDGLVVLVVGEGHLGFTIWAYVRHNAFFPHLSQPSCQAVRQRNGQRHELGSFVGGVAEHQALVAGTVAVVVFYFLARAHLMGVFHTGADFVTLLTDSDGHAAGSTVEAYLGGGEANVAEAVTHQLRNFDVAGAAYLPHHMNKPGGHHGFHGNVRVGVFGEHGVQDGVRDGVADFIRVAFRDGFAGEKAELAV